MRRTTKTVLVLSALVLFGCGGNGANENGSELKGTIRIDGSSTVFPITEAVAEEFQKVHPRCRVTVGISGTGGGFKKFCIGETDINDASRPIKQVENKKAKENNVEYIELPVAFDGISIVTHKTNAFVDLLTVEELTRIWQPGSTVKSWKDVRNEWPDQPIALYGPGIDSGTFDYFTETINGESQSCRHDFTASEDDNVLVQGIAGDVHSLGFFGFAYYVENKDKLKLIPIDGGSGPIAPSSSSINDGTYAPLARPIFIYVTTEAAGRPEVREFIRFYLKNAPVLVSEVGYVPLPDAVYALALARFEKGVAGTVYADGKQAGKTLEQMFDLGM